MEIKENRAFSEMQAVALGRLAGRSPLEIAEKAHILFDQESGRKHHRPLSVLCD